MDRQWRAWAVRSLQLQPGDRVLDLACGTGDFLLPLARAGADAVGGDFSPGMLAVAAGKGYRSLVLADALALPFADDSFDAVTVGWGLRNFANLSQAVREVRRVLRPGGRFAALDMMVPRNRLLRGSSRLVLGRVIPMLGAAVGSRDQYAYLPDSILTFATPEEIVGLMGEAGFATAEARPFFAQNLVLITGQRGVN